MPSKNDLKNVRVIENAISNIVFNYGEFNTAIIKEMLDNIHIQTALTKLENNLKAREWSIHGVDEDTAKLIESRMQFNMSRTIEYFNSVRNYGYGVFEKIYDDNFNLVDLVQVPQELLTYDVTKKRYQINSTNEGILHLDDDYKYLVVEYKPTLVNHGVSIMRYLYKSYIELKTVDTKKMNIVNKYGDVLAAFGHNPNDNPDDVNSRAEQIDGMVAGEDIVSIPIDEEHSIEDYLKFYTLDDLKIEIHNILEDRFIKAINKYILSADFTDSSNATGSQARDKVQLEEMEKAEDSMFKWIRDSLQDLINKDNKFFGGYNANDYYFKFQKELDEKEELEKDKTKADILSTKAEVISKLKASNVQLSVKAISEMTGIEESEIEIIANDNNIEFEEIENDVKKKLDLNLEINLQFDEDYLQGEQKFIDETRKQIQDHVNNSNTVAELGQLSLGYEALEQTFIISAQMGICDEDDVANLIKTYNPKTMPNPYNQNFEQVFAWMYDRKPALIDEFENITAEVRANFSWIKKSTDKKLTEKLFKSLYESEKNLESFVNWKERSKEVFEELGIGDNPWYLKNVYRTNNATAYNLGRYKQQWNTRKIFEYWMYDAVMDNRTSKICSELNGSIYKSESTIWDKIYPPSHYFCRSNVISLTKEQFENAGYKLSSKPSKAIIESLGEFDSNVGKYWKKMESVAKKNEKSSQEAYEQLSII